MKRVFRLGCDLVGLMRVCGAAVALRWLFNILTRPGKTARSGNLQSADAAMGEGPFTVTLESYGCRFQIAGPSAFTGIREMYVRDVYLRNGWLALKPNDVVMDLGANMGNFSALALAVDPSVRVIAVEPSSSMNARLVSSVGLNRGFLDRVQLIRAFVGRSNQDQGQTVSEPDYCDAEWISEDDLIRRADVQGIDFLKCDIEGGEFGLLGPHSKLLDMTKALACEVHAFAGDVPRFLSDITASGFTLGPIQRSPDGSSTFLAKRVTAER